MTKSMLDTTPQIAWCWANGVIEFGDKEPPTALNGAGAIVIATGPKAALKNQIKAVARHGYNEGVLLVPGVPEALTPLEKYQALNKWLAWRNKCTQRDGVVYATALNSETA